MSPTLSPTLPSARPPPSRYITSLASNVSTAAVTGGTVGAEEAASARPTKRITSSFRYTNGQRAIRMVGEPPRAVPRTVIETYKGEIRISADLCWYLDAVFCSSLHALKRSFSSPAAMHTIFATLLFPIWGERTHAHAIATAVYTRRVQYGRQ